MADKKILVVTGVLVVGAAAVLLFDKNAHKPDPRAGQPLLASAQALGVDAVDVKKGESSIALRRDADGIWHLGDASGFPVDAAKVARLIDDLGRATYQTVVGNDKDSLNSFGLAQPTAVRASAQGKGVLELNLGDQRQGGGQYAAVGSEAKVYLASDSVAVSPDADFWEMKTLLDLNKDQVKSVSFTPAANLHKETVALAREAPTAVLKVAGLEAGQKESPAAEGLAAQFNGVAFTKHYDAANEEAKAALAAPSQAVITLFDGRRYDVAVGSVGDKTKKYFLRIHGDKGSATLDDRAQKALDSLNGLMARYAFEVSAYVAQRFEKGRSDFIEPATKG